MSISLTRYLVEQQRAFKAGAFDRPGMLEHRARVDGDTGAADPAPPAADCQ